MPWVLYGGQRATSRNGSHLSFHFNAGSGDWTQVYRLLSILVPSLVFFECGN